MAGNQGTNHFGVVTEYPANVLAYKFKFYCEDCHFQSYQETRALAITAGKQHQAQFGYTQPNANFDHPENQPGNPELNPEPGTAFVKPTDHVDMPAPINAPVGVTIVTKAPGVTQQVVAPTK